MAFLEAGGRAVYCTDILEHPEEEWTSVREFLSRVDGMGRLEYVRGDVRNQVRNAFLAVFRCPATEIMRTKESMWKIAKDIADKEGRLDICVAVAGVWNGDIPSLEMSDSQFTEVGSVVRKSDVSLINAYAGHRREP